MLTTIPLRYDYREDYSSRLEIQNCSSKLHRLKFQLLKTDNDTQVKTRILTTKKTVGGIEIIDY